ncbi:hypothetical protein EYF80_005654 [Liparis tanakae]|uniref:Uncharacterized protein n=1 Tax=Liparis tanakae TaxID=230148 RepID=A0A4Z2J2W1_9TELE|nr:hypothetical protein EYF80_005654 [Liparis tanakae]
MMQRLLCEVSSLVWHPGGGADHIQYSTNHEGIGSGALVIGRVPGSLKPERVGVQLADHDHAVVLLGGIDHPQPVLVYCQVKLHNVAGALFVEKHGAVVDHKSRPIHPVGQLVEAYEAYEYEKRAASGQWTVFCTSEAEGSVIHGATSGEQAGCSFSRQTTSKQETSLHSPFDQLS